MNEETHQPEIKKSSNSKQYLSIGLILILLGTGIAMIYKSCAPKKSVMTKDITSSTKEIMDENDFQPEDQTLNDIIDKQDVDIEDQDEDFSTEGSDDSDDTHTAIEEPQHTTISNQPATTILSDEVETVAIQSKYMVITGSFGSINNARKRLEKTIASGYRNAEIVQFDNSKYHTVCALRTDQESTARTAIQRLKSKKVDAFLHIQRANK